MTWNKKCKMIMERILASDHSASHTQSVMYWYTPLVCTTSLTGVMYGGNTV